MTHTLYTSVKTPEVFTECPCTDHLRLKEVIKTVDPFRPGTPSVRPSSLGRPFRHLFEHGSRFDRLGRHLETVGQTTTGTACVVAACAVQDPRVKTADDAMVKYQGHPDETGFQIIAFWMLEVIRGVHQRPPGPLLVSSCFW